MYNYTHATMCQYLKTSLILQNLKFSTFVGNQNSLPESLKDHFT